MSKIMRLIQKFVFKGGSKPKHFLFLIFCFNVSNKSSYTHNGIMAGYIVTGNKKLCKIYFKNYIFKMF